MPPETALVITTPPIEPHIGRIRARYDPSAGAGVAAHITLLYPFLAPAAVDGGVLDALQECFARVTPISFELGKLRRFPGVLYLAPEPDEPFRRLTRAIWSLYPQAPPYGGRHPDIVPHVCVAQVADENKLDELENEFKRVTPTGLRVPCRASEITLLERDEGQWHRRHAFPLGQ